VDIWDREDLWVSIDRANLNPPNKGIHASEGFIHWDADTSLKPLPIGVQGVLSLAKQDKEVGGFQCVPELFRTLEEWIETQPADRHPRFPDTTGFEVVTVNMNPGDFLIFNSLLAHGIRPNRSEDRVRMAQYISMKPADEDAEEERQARVNGWRTFEGPGGKSFPGDPREWEKKNAQTARLTPLGEKLLGLKSWK
jgi:ectoine hydroxylase-related dioxygenase (phytanoyl-CoA dioxygenase family)